MADYLYLWNPKRWEWKDFPHAVRLVHEGRGYEDTWSCGGTKAIRPGDRFLLHRVGVEPRGIWGCGIEGGRRIVTRATYDRSAAARLACLEAWGFDCAVCGFNFGKEYGDIGEGYIEVHHLRPLASVGEAHPVNPVDDLRPVCANCHRMLHHVGEVRSISELKDHLSTIAEGGDA